MTYDFHNCTVLQVIEQTEYLRRFIIKVSDDFHFTFKAGQFVIIDFPLPHKVIDRSYSIASAPSDDNIFELVVVLKPGGIGSTYLFEHIKKGSALKVSKALGKFQLPEHINSDLCFACTGTGIAPLRSMLLDIFNTNIPHKNIYMVFGNRWTKDILYNEEMKELAAHHPEFKFIPVLSRYNTGWTGRTGYIHTVYEELFADKRPAWFYISGWPVIVREARKRIEEMGYDKNRIKFELY